MITLICSNYNSSRWIKGYLESINNLLYDTFDIIFVDANSTDDSLQTIRDYAFREGINKRVIEKSTRVGIYEAWNIAIEEADTTYVMNINTDDRLYPAALDIYLSYAANNPNVDIFYGSCNVVSEENHTTITNVYSWPEFSHDTLLQNCICGPFPMLKRSSVVAAGMFDPKYTISGDYEMWLRMSKLGYKFQKVGETVGSYFLNPEGMSTTPEKYMEHIKQDTTIREMYR